VSSRTVKAPRHPQTWIKVNAPVDQGVASLVSALGEFPLLVAAVLLARDDISSPSPRLHSVIADSVGLARMIFDRIVR
jgi:hypothetical protein